MTSYLVVANKTLGGAALAAHLRRVIEADPAARFVVVVPVRAPVMDLSAGMVGIAVIDAGTQEHLEEVARGRLTELLDWFREAGVEATGEVMAGDPVAAIDEVARAQDFDEIIISTLPERVSQWIRMDVINRAQRRFSVPVTAVIGDADDESLPRPALGPPVDTAGTDPLGMVADESEVTMGESVYKVIELVGTSTESWEKAAAAAVAMASRTLRNLRVAEVAELDLVIDDGVVSAYRAKVKVSFKYEGEE